MPVEATATTEAAPDVGAEVPPTTEAVAEPESPAPKISGHIEAAYHLAASAPKGQGTPLLLRSYDAMGRNSFALHAAHLAVSHALNDEVSGTIEIDAGSDAAADSYAYGSGLFDVQEAYLTYKPSNFSVTAGKYVTYEGIEVIEGPLNPTLTRGYLFGLAEPFTTTGVKAHYDFDGKADLGLGFVNGWDNIIDDNGAKMLAFRLGATPSDTFFAALSGYIDIGGKDGHADNGLMSFDLTASVTLSDEFVLWFQGNYGRQKAPPGGDDPSWFGLGVQPVYTMNDFSFGGRIEFFSDKEGVRTLTGPDASFLNITLTPGYNFGGGFTARFEYRMDLALSEIDVAPGVSTKEVFINPDDGQGSSSQHTLGLGAHYVF